MSTPKTTGRRASSWVPSPLPDSLTLMVALNHLVQAGFIAGCPAAAVSTDMNTRMIDVTVEDSNVVYLWAVTLTVGSCEITETRNEDNRTVRVEFTTPITAGWSARVGTTRFMSTPTPGDNNL